MTKDSLISLENLVQLLTFAYIRGNNLSDITPKELIEEISDKLEPMINKILA
ncbi:hypothetical protein [Priestia aryabhattai]|uniref:hypothetical protein n=1 Tax=Priestia aryabhattai TaxID=412384 RepID=UPI003CFAE5DE